MKLAWKPNRNEICLFLNFFLGKNFIFGSLVHINRYEHTQAFFLVNYTYSVIIETQF